MFTNLVLTSDCYGTNVIFVKRVHSTVLAPRKVCLKLLLLLILYLRVLTVFSVLKVHVPVISILSSCSTMVLVSELRKFNLFLESMHSSMDIESA